MTTSLEIRNELIDALRLDLVGPISTLGMPNETLPQTPSRWYLSGFLVPTEADESQRVDPTSDDALDQAAEPASFDDDETPEPAAARRSYLPSSMGISILFPHGTDKLTATIRHGDYIWRDEDLGLGTGERNQSLTPKPQSRRRKPYRLRWPDDFRDEVLARLLELNEQRAMEEKLAGKTTGDKQPQKHGENEKKPRAKKKAKDSSSAQKKLGFEDGME